MQDRTQQIVERMIAAGESEQDIAAVIQQLKPATSSPRESELHPHARVGKFVTNIMRRENWPMIGGGVGAMIGGIPGAALGGAVGKMAQMQTDAVGGKEPESVPAMARDIGVEGAIQGGIEGAGRGIVRGGGKVANVLMRRALGPSKAAGLKYGDLPQQALDRRTLVSEGGADKVQGIREAGQLRKVNAIENARPVSVLTDPIKRGAADQTIDTAVGQQIAGMRPTMAPSHAVERFGGGRRGISLKESELAKKQFDNATDAARQAKRMGKRPSLGDEERIALSREILNSQDAIVPGIRDMNREISQTMGLEQAIRQRIAQPGAGLADEAAIMGSMVDPRMALSRVVREPQALSALSILINELSKGGKVAPTAARALLATSHNQETRR